MHMLQNYRTNPTLVVGSSGKIGRRVADKLRAKGVAVRAGSRTGERPFDWDNPNTWSQALEGVDSAYVSYYPDLAFPGGAEAVGALCEMAKESGVRRLVLLSGRGEEGALKGELAVRNSGLEWTIVRSSFFNQNFSESFLVEALIEGVVAFPAGDVKEPFIDADDIAEVATLALTEDGHVGQIYEVTGPRLMTFAEAVQEIAEATGREIQFIPVTSDQYRAAMIEHGVPVDFAANLCDLFATVLDGRNASLSDGVARALGRPPRDFRDFAHSAAAAGVWTGGAAQ